MLTNNNTRQYFPNQNQNSKSIITSKSVPFFINSPQLISESRLSRIYKCDYIMDNAAVQQQLIERISQVKDTIDPGQQPQPYNSYISPLKCKIVNFQQHNHQQQIPYMMQYLHKLRFYYQYNDNIVHHNRKDFLLSSNKNRHQQSLKLCYFHLQHRKQFTPKVIKLIADYLQNYTSSTITSAGGPISISEKKESINIETVNLLILDYVVDQNSYIREKALAILLKAIRKNYTLINLPFIKRLSELMSHKSPSTKNNITKLLKQCLSKLSEIKNYQQKPQSQQQQKQQQQLIQSKQLLQLIDLACRALNVGKQQVQYKKSKTKNNSSQSLTSNKDQSISADQLSEVLTKNYLTNVNFSRSLNVQMNQNLQSYQNYISSQKIKQTAYKEEFLYIINEYHHGKTFKELIMNNWKGFQNHDVVLKLSTKLLWIYAKLEYCGFDDYVPTLQNIVINQNLTMPDVNINMTSFLNSIFLFQSNEFLKKDSSLSDRYLSHKVKRSSLEQFLPFIYSDGIEKGFSKVNRKNNFLIILLFMICRRLDHFQGLPSIFKNLQTIIQKNIEAPIKKYKQMLDKYKKQQQQKTSESEVKKMNLNFKDRKQKILKQKLINQKLLKMKILNDEASRHSLANTLKVIDFIEPFDEIDRGHFLNLAFYHPQMYSIFLKKYELPTQNVKQYEKISYKNSNTYRINEFQKYLGLKENELLNIFQKNLASPSKEKIINSTWRDLYCLLFTKGQQAIVQESQLLAHLCRFFNCPFQKQIGTENLSPQIYFALKFDIDFSYFQEKYQGKWFNCFETSSNQGKIQYEMQTMCLLKNIKSQVIKITNGNVEKMIEIIQESQNLLLGYQKRLTTTQDDKKSICQKLQAGIDLLKYLNNYEKKVYTQELKRAQEKPQSQKKISLPKSEQKKLEYFTNDYFETFSEKDIDELEEILELFILKMNLL